ncbi:hypothetical protein C0583_07055 [Candidatus Parcubacteria bacterium]|nr:MAG: hypothetical protein C0583_07055 [Candidatus Parcubacteria bacterium]
MNDKIEVIARFKDGDVMPAAFRWQNRVYDSLKLNMVHKERDGNDMIYYFSVSDEANFFRLAFFTRDLNWKIQEVFYK